MRDMKRYEETYIYIYMADLSGKIMQAAME